MTNDIKISRELAERLAHVLYMHDAENTDAATELEALIAAPVVESQEPVAPAFIMPSNENSYGFGYVDGTCIQSLRGYRDHLEEIVDSIPEGPLYTSPPAPVSTDLIRLLARARIYARGEFRDEIDACLAGKPVPVAVPDDIAQNSRRYEWIRSPNVGHCEISRLLFETISDDCNPPYRSLKCGKDLDIAIDACIDKIKELNQ